jgi:mono/diheme cytochrome c family protein
MVRLVSFSLPLIVASVAAPKPVVLYEFDEDSGSQIIDSSGVNPPANLDIPDQRALKRESGSLTLLRPVLLSSKSPPAKLIKAIKRSGEITISAWITPTNLSQSGPARIVTISRNSSSRNVTLGQDKTKFDARFRTEKTGANGIPSLSSGKALTKKTHVVFTRSKIGIGRIYINGRKNGQRSFPGSLKNWDTNYRIALGNELSNNRPWLGTFHQVAIYSQALSPSEIADQFQNGLALAKPKSSAERSRVLFTNHIEPILAKHCLECHDSTTNKGDLDLSHQKTAFLDPEIISAGHLKKSLVWESVESDEMPKKRKRLSSQEKAHLREWIETGAVWSDEHIDPAAHLLLTNPKKFPRRLTTSEYIATVKAATGVDIEKEARKLLPNDLRTDGFSNTAYNLGVDLKHVEAHAQLANLIVEKLNVQKFANRFSSNRKTNQKAIRPHLQTLGTWVLRGPLPDHEIDLYQGIVTSVGASGGDFDTAFAYVLRGMFQSPRFLYRIESEGSPDAYELASRLSYLVWGSPPDQELFNSARNNLLYNPDQIHKQVTRMLKDPRALVQSLTFISEWLNLNHLQNLQPNQKEFPFWNPKLAEDMRRETLAFSKHLLWEEQRPLGDLLNARITFLTPSLAKHYGLKPKAAMFTKYDLSNTPRGGLLTQGSLLTIGGDEASMVTRGLFVLHDLLRGSVKDPPPGVDTTPVPSAPGLSQRKVAERRMLDQSCGGCHVKFEPLAFGLEQYDGLARYTTRDHFKNELRQDGEILIPGTPAPVEYKTSRELMDLLAKSPRVRQNIIWKLTQFSLGRPIATTDRLHLDKLFEKVRDRQTYQNVILHLATSPLITE